MIPEQKKSLDDLTVDELFNIFENGETQIGVVTPVIAVRELHRRARTLQDPCITISVSKLLKLLEI